MKINPEKYKTVLVIDDEDVDLFLAKKVLGKMKSIENVILYSNGKQAFSFIKNIKKKEEVPELILLDLKMPGFSGEDFLNQFQELPEYISSHTKVVVVSAYLGFHEGEHINSKMFPCIHKLLQKPLKQDELEMV